MSSINIKQGRTAENDAPLWEHDHPYYANTGNYFEGYPFPGTRSGTWAEFIEEMGDADEDMNLVYRWDWIKADPADYEYEHEEDPNFELPGDRLMVFYMGQRKAYCWSWEIAVTEADEPAVRDWLARKADHMCRLWSPFLTRPIPPEEKS